MIRTNYQKPIDLRNNKRELSFISVGPKNNNVLIISKPLGRYKSEESNIVFDKKKNEKKKVLIRSNLKPKGLDISTLSTSHRVVAQRLFSESFNSVKIHSQPLKINNAFERCKSVRIIKKNSFQFLTPPILLNLAKISFKSTNFENKFQSGSQKYLQCTKSVFSSFFRIGFSSFSKSNFLLFKTKLFSKSLSFKISLLSPNLENFKTERHIKQNLKKNSSLSIFLKSTVFDFFKTYFIFIKNRTVRWQSSIPFFNRQINRFICFYKETSFFSHSPFKSNNQKKKFKSKTIIFSPELSKLQNFSRNKVNFYCHVEYLFIDHEISQNSFLFSKNVQFYKKEKLNLKNNKINTLHLTNVTKEAKKITFKKVKTKKKKNSLEILMEIYTKILNKHNPKMVWIDFYLEFKDLNHIRAESRLNIFLFNEFFHWLKKQHTNNSNSWIFSKYWLFLMDFERNRAFDFLLREIQTDGLNFPKHDGYFCLKQFFSKKGTSLKRKKLFLKTWYLKKYKKKKISFKINKNTELSNFVNKTQEALVEHSNDKFKLEIDLLTYQQIKSVTANPTSLSQEKFFLFNFLDQI